MQIQNNIKSFQSSKVITEFSTQNLSNPLFPKISLCPQYMFNPEKLIKFGLNISMNEGMNWVKISDITKKLYGINSSFTFAQLYQGAKWHLHDIVESIKLGNFFQNNTQKTMFWKEEVIYGLICFSFSFPYSMTSDNTLKVILKSCSNLLHCSTTCLKSKVKKCNVSKNWNSFVEFMFIYLLIEDKEIDPIYPCNNIRG